MTLRSCFVLAKQTDNIFLPHSPKVLLLAAISAKYIHAPLSVLSLKAYCDAHLVSSSACVSVRVFTINHSEDFILSEIYRARPAAVGFSCYIWNIGLIRKLLASIRQILPEAVIILGGPEASYGKGDLLVNGLCGVIVTGEGEEAFCHLARLIVEEDGLNTDRLSGIPGIMYLNNGRVLSTPSRHVQPDSLPFAYPQDYDFRSGGLIYYESSRGCPFECGYCMSAADKGLRLKSPDTVKRELKRFIDKGARTVKFVDRTFNADKARTMEIFKFLAENGGDTCFHFEIRADFLDDEIINFLSDVREGLFQFEIGVQSANTKTLELIDRKTDLTRLAGNVHRLRAAGNIHLHLDLIAGLPGEGYQSFGESFNFVYALKPHHLQLGFLKLLPGAPLTLRAREYGITARETPPYEVLYTHVMPYEGLMQLKRIEDMLEQFYNSGAFKATIMYTDGIFGSAFSFYENLAIFYEERGYHLAAHGRAEQYAILHEFLSPYMKEGGCNEKANLIDELLLFDLLMQDRNISPPACLSRRPAEKDKKTAAAILKSYGSSGKRLFVERFSFDIGHWYSDNGANVPVSAPKRTDNYILFEYPLKSGEGTRIQIFTNDA